MENEIKNNVDKILVKLSLHKTLFVVSIQSYNNPIEVVKNTNTNAPAYTDGVKIYLNEIFDINNIKKLLVLIMHECLHIIMLHFKRCKNKNPMLWNIATDYAINTTLIPILLEKGIEINGVKITPEDIPNIMTEMKGCYNNEFFGMTEEEIYKLLQDEQEQNPRNFNMQDDGENITVEHNGKKLIHKKQIQIDEASDEIASEIFKEAVKKIQGDNSDIINRILNNALRVKIDVKKALANAINSIITKGNDFGWSKIRTSGLTLGQMMPGIIDEERRNKLFIAIDESGSLSNSDLQKFADVISKFLSYFNELIIVRHDSKVTDIKEYKTINKDIILKEVLRRYSCGGTSHNEVFNLINKKHLDSDLFIFLTDGYSDLEKFKPYPNLILIMGGSYNKNLNNYKKVIFED